MHSVWLGEFMGTLVLVLLGNGVCAGVTLRKSYAANAGWMAITTGWALGVLCGVLVAQAFGSPGASLNPAITLAVAVNTGNFQPVLSQWSAQLLGAMGGASLVVLHYGPHWALTPDPAAKLGIFCTNAAVRNPLFNIFSEALGTAVLVVVAGAIGSRGVSATGPAAGVGPWLVASRCGASAWAWAGPLVTPSTPRAIWVRGWSTLYSRFPARAARTGVTRPSPSSATSRAVLSPACFCTTRTSEVRRKKPGSAQL